MKRYSPATPPKTSALAAAALSALTITASVLLPAQVPAAASAGSPWMASATTGRSATAVLIRPARIEVIGLRSPDVAARAAAGTGA
jgi:hypothetical protein